MSEYLSTAEKKTIFFLGIFGVIGLVLMLINNTTNASDEKITVSHAKVEKQAETIIVHVEGAVKKPGVYQLEKGDRLMDLMHLAGLREDADRTRINLARKLRDEEKVMVFSTKDKENASFLNSTQFQASVFALGPQQIDINRARISELEALPGIGPKLAASIVQFREKNGSFKSPVDLMSVPGIGQKRYEALRDQIVVW